MNNWEIRMTGGDLSVRFLDASGAVIKQADSALATSAVARSLGKSLRQVYRYRELGLLPAIGKFLGEYLFDADDVWRFKRLAHRARPPMRLAGIPPVFQPFFPEYRVAGLNPWINAPLVISRLLDTGGRREWRWIFKNYPRRTIRSVVRDHGLRLMSPRSCHFWCWLLSLRSSSTVRFDRGRSPGWA